MQRLAGRAHPKPTPCWICAPCADSFSAVGFPTSRQVFLTLRGFRPLVGCPNPNAATHYTPLTSARSDVAEGSYMYGHSHTGIGALVLTLVAGAKGGIGYLVRAIASPHW